MVQQIPFTHISPRTQCVLRAGRRSSVHPTHPSHPSLCKSRGWKNPEKVVLESVGLDWVRDRVESGVG